MDPRRFLFVVALLLPSASFAHPVVDGTCPPDVIDCPYRRLTDDLRAVTDAACPEKLDFALLAKYRRGAKLTQNEFVKLIIPFAQASERATGVPASVTIAQAILETGWGKTARHTGNNLFGIKGRGTAGSHTAWTREYVRGRWVRVRAKFASYGSMEDAFIAHANLISGKKRYAKAMAVRGDAYAFARAVHRAGYATDPGYTKKLHSIMRSRKLTQYDDSVDCGGEA